MSQRSRLTEPFEQNRGLLRGLAYQILGSLSEADDALQEVWLRLNRTETSDVGDLRGWLTTVVATVCLDVLRARQRRPSALRPEPIVGDGRGPRGEEEARLGDSIRLALLVVLEKLPPAERVAFVLHDIFAVPFEEIAPIVRRSPDAARELASHGRRRMQCVGGAPADVRHISSLPSVNENNESRTPSRSAVIKRTLAVTNEQLERARRPTMKPHVSVITLGVRDMNRARQFYSEGLGWPIQHEQAGHWLSFSLNNNAFGLGLQPWEALARDANAGAEGSGFRGVTLSYIVDSEERVDAVLAEAKHAGGKIAKSAQKAQWGGYFGYFTDPEGYLWKVVAGAGRQPFAAE